MKTLNIICSFLFVCILGSLTTVTNAQNTSNGPDPDMQVYSIPNTLVIDYINPAQERVEIVVSDLHGNPLEVFVTHNPGGTISYTAEELEAKGGTGVYEVTMYGGDDRKVIKKSTIVIIKE